MVGRCANLVFRGDAFEAFILVGIMGDCVIEVSNVQIGIVGLYSLEEETLYAFSKRRAPITQ
jgi:hypothetical protein